jgi:thymidine kinase
MAKLYFKYGTMGSTKTMNLLTTAYNLEEKGISVMCMKPSVDTRDGLEVIKSRIGIEKGCVIIYPDSDLYKSIQNIRSVEAATFKPITNWILVDEAQFLSKEQINSLAKVVDDFNVNVMCFGLRTDFKSNLFEGSKRLFEIADSIEELKSICECGKKTIINARIDENGNVITDGNQIEIGGNDKYVSMCRKCWYDKIKNLNK